MISASQIPDEVWHTAMSTYHKTIKKRPGSAWQEAIAAALNAWPKADQYLGAVVLPLPQEEKFQPYTCIRCLGATENADDICDDCAQEARDE